MGATWLDRLQGWLSLGPPVIELGSSNKEAVSNWQHLIGVMPADGSFGPITDIATKAFQKANEIEPDGVVGPKTWSAIQSRVTSLSAPVAEPSALAPPTAKPLGTVPLPQAIGNRPAITAWAIELVNSPTKYPMYSTNMRDFGDIKVVGRIEKHTWTHRAGKLVTNLKPPIRGATLYMVTDIEAAGFGCEVDKRFQNTTLGSSRSGKV